MNREKAFKLLKERCEVIVKYNTLFPEEIVKIANDYLYSNCKSKRDYQTLVIESINNTTYRDYLLNN